MKLTTNYSLKKPEGSDVVNIDDFNYNADIIDNAIQEIKNTSSTNKTSISNLQTKVDNGQVYKLTTDDGTNIHISGQDLNTLKTNGQYFGSELINAPHNYFYYVEVMTRGDSLYTYQRITALNDTHMGKFERTCRNGTWEAWRTLAGQNLKLTNNNGQIDVTYGGDFNTLTKTGWYYITSPTNSPTSGGAWYLEVMSRDGGYVYQRATRNENGNNNLAKYERTMHNNTWTAWREL